MNLIYDHADHCLCFYSTTGEHGSGFATKTRKGKFRALGMQHTTIPVFIIDKASLNALAPGRHHVKLGDSLFVAAEDFPDRTKKLHPVEAGNVKL